MKTLKEKFENIHLLSRAERRALTDELTKVKPDFLKSMYPVGGGGDAAKQRF